VASCPSYTISSQYGPAVAAMGTSGQAFVQRFPNPRYLSIVTSYGVASNTRQTHIAQRTLHPRFVSPMASYDAASKDCQALGQRHVTRRMLSPRFLSRVASYDAVSNVCQTLTAGARVWGGPDHRPVHRGGLLLRLLPGRAHAVRLRPRWPSEAHGGDHQGEAAVPARGGKPR